MSEKYKPVKGDRVRVVIEDTVIAPANAEGAFETVNNWFEGTKGHVVSVEKIETTVEVFKPGDRLREKRMGYEVTLASKGYLHHFNDGEVEYYRVPSYPSFTSRDYERVTLS